MWLLNQSELQWERIMNKLYKITAKWVSEGTFVIGASDIEDARAYVSSALYDMDIASIDAMLTTIHAQVKLVEVTNTTSVPLSTAARLLV
jgi:hypothetical protein